MKELGVLNVVADSIELLMFMFLLTDDDGDGKKNEDCAKPAPSE